MRIGRKIGPLEAVAYLSLAACVLGAEEKTAPTNRGRSLDELAEVSATGPVLPNKPVDSRLTVEAPRVTAWRSDGTQRLLLEGGGVRVSVGSYGFRASRAVVFITPRERPGPTAREIAVYLDEVQSLGGSGPVQAEGRRFLVTAVITGGVEVKTSVLDRTSAASDPLVQAARRRVDRHFKAIAAKTVDLPKGPPLVSEKTLQARKKRRAKLKKEMEGVPPELTKGPLPPKKKPPERPGPPRPSEVEGTVRFRAENVVYREGEKESTVILSGGLKVLHRSPSADRRLSLQADKGVVFLEPGALDKATSRKTQASNVRGIYLEDNVLATTGDYAVRGPRMFYNLRTDRAVVLEAVFFTWSVRRQVPIYVRARELRQHSRDTWSAEDARLTTSAFHKPHFSIGAGSVRISAKEDSAGNQEVRYDAENITFNVEGIPFFYWPGMEGEVTDTPLKSVEVESDSQHGGVIETRWDLFSLLNTSQPEGVDGELLLDGRTKRGGAAGLDLEYDRSRRRGVFEGYFQHDQGEDEPGGREEITPETEYRGKALWRHREFLSDDLLLDAQVGWLSDPTFLEEFFPEEANASKRYETSVYLKKQEQDWAASFLTKYDPLDFVPQTPFLQTAGNRAGPSVGYDVEKLPEVEYRRVATSLFDGAATWYSETRAGAVRLSFPEQTPAELGFNAADSVARFGIARTVAFDRALTRAGLDEDSRFRGHTRQEIQVPLQIGKVDAVPYVSGQATAYGDHFEAFRGEDEQIRGHGSAGVRLHSSFSRTYSAESDLLDVHGIRHIVEPSANLYYAESNVAAGDIPIFDYSVESLSQGRTARIGLRNTYQTKRGGPGNWRSVDWLRIDTDVVFTSDEERRLSPIGRFFDQRPELSIFTDHFAAEAAWQVTDTLSFVGNYNFGIDSGELERWNVGANIDHTPRFRSFGQVRSIDVVNSTIMRFGFDYRLTTKYRVEVAQSFDLEDNESRDTSVTLTRRMPRWLLMLALNVDSLTGETSVGVAVSPEGLGGGRRNPFLSKTSYTN